MAISDNTYLELRVSQWCLIRILGSQRTQCLATNFPALAADLVPGSIVHLVRTITQLSCKHDDLADHQFSNAARVAEWRVKDGDTLVSSILQVNLIGPNTETANDNKILCFLQNPLGKLGLGADADDMDVSISTLSQLQVRFICACRDERPTESFQSIDPLEVRT